MAIHDFRHIPKKSVLHSTGVVNETAPILPTRTIGNKSTTPQRVRMYDQLNVNVPEETVHKLVPGLHHTDVGIKNYFSDIVVPTDDGIRSTTVPIRIAGGDKATLYWKQLIRDELRNGRIKLPVMALNRESFEYNPLKFSPPHVPIAREFADAAGTRMRMAYRPYPVIINYTLGLWAERKRDIEYMLFQIVPRFNGGLAEIKVDSGLITGTAVMKFNGFTDVSEVELDADSHAKVQYDLTISVESFMPLPEKITKTVLGHVATLHEMSGEFLEVANIGIVAASISESDASPK